MTEPVYFSTVTSLRSAILRKCITFNHTHKLTDYTFNHIQMLLWEIVNIVSKVPKNCLSMECFCCLNAISSRLLIGQAIKVNIISKAPPKKKRKYPKVDWKLIGKQFKKVLRSLSAEEIMEMKASFEHKYIEQEREQRMERIKQTANDCYINLLVRFINLRRSLEM